MRERCGGAPAGVLVAMRLQSVTALARAASGRPTAGSAASSAAASNARRRSVRGWVVGFIAVPPGGRRRRGIAAQRVTASLAPGRCNVLMEHDGFAVEIDGNRCPRPGRAAVLDEVNTAGLVYVFPGGELDSARHRLLVDGELIELEPKAFDVLADLLAHDGAMRSRDDLLHAVWGHRHVTPAVLNRCIGQVRKALGDHADAPRFVRTVHTLGYTFITPVEVRGESAGPPREAPAAPAPPPTEVRGAPARRPRRRILGWALAAIAVLTFG